VGALRDGQPTREAARSVFDTRIHPVYASADFNKLASVLANWGRLIHSPITATRRRVYPQQLVHDLLNAFGIADSAFDSIVMRDIGIFSRMIQDVEAVWEVASTEITGCRPYGTGR
jgi:DNA helicase-2/ATP-dependent DNA helicase PcrA